MKLILKQIALLVAALLALYGVLLAITLLLVPRADPGARLNADRATASLFMTEPKYVFMARSRLNTLTDKAILLGASNVHAGFKLDTLQPLVPGIELHDLAVGGSNITQVSQIVDLVREVQTPEARRHNVYVIGLWYGLFADDQARWHTPDRHAGDTDIDIERYRYGFYRRTQAGAVPVLPPRHLDVGVLLVHPYLVLDRTARDLTATLRSFKSPQRQAITDEQRNAIVISEAEQRKYLAFWRNYMGPEPNLGDAPFRVLERLVDGILAEGGRVVLVDMPIPSWHAHGSALAADYRQRTDTLLAHLRARAGVAVLTMDGAAADDDFRDEVHPKPRVTERWATRLADTLNTRLNLTRAQSVSAR